MVSYQLEDAKLQKLNGRTWKNPLYIAIAFAYNGENTADPQHIVVDFNGNMHIMRVRGVSSSVSGGLAFYEECEIVGISVYKIPPECSTVEAFATIAANPIIARITKCMTDGTFSRCIHPPQSITAIVSPIVEADFDGENSNIRKSASVIHSSPTEHRARPL